MIWWFSKIGISVLGENMWLQLGEMCHWQRAAWKNSKINNINIPTFSAQPALRLCFLRKCHDFFYTFFPCNYYFIFAQRPGPHETVETVAPVAVRCACVNRVYATCNVSILCQYYATLTHTGKKQQKQQHLQLSYRRHILFQCPIFCLTFCFFPDNFKASA